MTLFLRIDQMRRICLDARKIDNLKISKPQSAICARNSGQKIAAICAVFATLIASECARATDATAVLWSSAGGSAWLTGTNWTGNAVPTGTQIAQFGVNPTSSVTGVGINFHNTTNAGTQLDGQRIEEVGAIEMTSARTGNLIIGNSSITAGATGTLRLNGVTVNGVDNVILRNNSIATLAIRNIQGAGNQTMDVELGNAVDNVINIDSSGSITIDNVIKNGAGSHLTLSGAGSGALLLYGASTYSGGTTVSAGVLELGSNGVVSGGVIASGPVGAGTLTLGDGVTLRCVPINDRFIQNNLSLSGSITLGDAANSGGLNFSSTDPFSGNSLTTAATVTLTGNTTLTTLSLVTIADVISGGFSLTKAGASTLTLTAANTYSGGTTLNAGQLNIQNASAIGTGTFTINGGTISNTSGAAVTLATNNALTINGDFTFFGTNSLNLGTGAVSLGTATGATRTITVTANTLSLGGAISDGTATGIIKDGTGTLTLSGASTYSGGTTLNAGTLQLGTSSTGSVTNGPVGTGTLTLNGGTLSSNVGDFVTTRSIANPITFSGDVTFGTNTNFGALSLSGAGTLTAPHLTLTFIADVTYSGNIGESGGSFGITKAGSGTLKLSGINTYSGGTTINAGLLWLNSSSALGSSSGTLTVNGGIVDLAGNSISVGNLAGNGGGTIWNNLGPNNAVTLTIGTGNNGGGNYQGVIQNNNGASSGTVALTKTGTGTITLSGANTYTGATTVNGGTLLINGSTAAGSAVTVNNTGTLGGTGTVSGTVDVKSGGTLSPGTSPGTLHTGALTLENGSTFAVDLTAASGNDLVVAPSVTLGTIVLGPGLSLNISGTLSIGQQFFIVNNTGASAVSGVFAQGATITSGGYTLTIDYLANFDTSLAVGGNDIMLEVTAVPEAETWLSGALAFAGLGLTHRRKVFRKGKR